MLSFVETLRLHNMFLHQLTPNYIARLNLYFWLVKTCRFQSSDEDFSFVHRVHRVKTCCFQPSAEDFSFVHRVHHQPEVISMTTADGNEGEAETQYGCYNFTFREMVSSPVTAYMNKVAFGLDFILVLT
jgi:hypothetical protein